MNTPKKITVALAGLVAFSALAVGVSQHPVAADAIPSISVRLAADRDDSGQGGHAERHPMIERALRQLNAAKDSLLHARHDFHGHRERALDLTQQAIDECQKALQSDRR